MLIFRFFYLILKIIFSIFLIVLNYFFIFLVRFLSFSFFFPVSFFVTIKSFLFFIIKFTVYYLIKLKLFLLFNVAKLNNIFVLEPIYQFFQHIFSFKILKEKIFRRFYFYRRSYYVSGRSLKLLMKAILTVELNALLIKRLVQPLKSLSLKAWDLLESRTIVGRRFRISRRLIKFFVGMVSFFLSPATDSKIFFLVFNKLFNNFIEIIRS